MRAYQRDPYALSIHRMGDGFFVNGMSINDPQSTQMVYRRLAERFGWKADSLILLINNRPDRGYRTAHMAMVAEALQPGEVWLTGASQLTVSRRIRKAVPTASVRCFGRVDAVPLGEIPAGCVVFAVGNVAGPGHEIMERVRKEGRSYVS